LSGAVGHAHGRHTGCFRGGGIGSETVTLFPDKKEDFIILYWPSILTTVLAFLFAADLIGGGSVFNLIARNPLTCLKP
jgi:hypothetical protein